MPSYYWKGWQIAGVACKDQTRTCRKRIKKAGPVGGSSESDFEPSGDSASDVSFESENESLSEEGEADVSGIYDDADLEQYNQVSRAIVSVSEVMTCI